MYFILICSLYILQLDKEFDSWAKQHCYRYKESLTLYVDVTI